MTSTDAGKSLFVFIPTYNRPDSLRRQLAALTGQRSDWPGAVRVLVSDNGSPALSEDDLAAIASEFGVEVRRNSANLGANANIALGFVFAQAGEWLWILSDNDTVQAGALGFLASECLNGAPDAITMETHAQEPATVTRTWRDGWGLVGEMGLISNVIYRMDAFADNSSQAFFFHNTGFPHLAVILATLRDAGSLRFRIVPSSRVFVPSAPHGEETGDYSVSLSGMPQLAWLLPPSEARRFCRKWLRAQGLGFIRYKNVHPALHFGTRAVLLRYLGFEARVTLWGLAILEQVRSVLPRGLKQRLRGRT